ncbi:MAG: hypothetical protein GX262_09070 [Clostridia bacterium]|nr:hypothetical protein [Clostridia bacterium]
MDWFMIAFIGFLCVLFAYYIERQIHDPGIKMFPFNAVDEYRVEMPSQEVQGQTAAQ